MKRIHVYFMILVSFWAVKAQEVELTYFLPDEVYNENIPTPKSVLGFQIGERHLTSDLILMYLKELARSSDRIILENYAVSHEKNPLILLIITSPENQTNIERIRSEHLKLMDPVLSKSLNLDTMPAVVYQGYSIHGNEPSGANASVLWAYYLAASQTEETKKLLKETIILIDPYLNPDGLNRYASWVNLNRGENNLPDKQERGHFEPWPSGRTNHYMFDMNRDWITTEQPESKGRVKTFHYWIPNFLTDHHEMGTSKTYFFQPGVPERVHPLTLISNQDLTAKIAKFHAAELDKIGSLYYSGEGYDDFYYGKGSAYPDVNGGIGILFEQASTGGPVKDSPNGPIDFPFSIRNQIQTSFSTVRGVNKYRKELLEYQRDFFKKAYQDGSSDIDRAYIFQEKYDKGRLKLFVEMLLRHNIELYKLNGSTKIDDIEFGPEHSFIIPLKQKQYKMIKSSFAKMKSFNDSIFYDVTSWTLPLAYNLEYATAKKSFSLNLLGEKITDTKNFIKLQQLAKSQYAYLFKWDDFLAPKALAVFQKSGIRTKVSTSSFTLEGETFEEGTILIPIQNQEKDAEGIYDLVLEAQQKSHVQMYSASTGLTPKGIDLGSPNFETLEIPVIALIVGHGVASYDVGEVWYLFDKVYNMPVVKLDASQLKSYDLNKYNVIIMTDGSYSTIGKEAIEDLKYAVKNGTTLIVAKKAVKWAVKNDLANVVLKKAEKAINKELKYNDHDADFRSMELKGTIFEATLDIHHPLGFGYKRSELPVFKRGDTFFDAPKNPYSSPLNYSVNPLLSGYIRKENYDALKNSSCIIISKFEKGKVICFTDNTNFRMLWKGTAKLFANAVFFGCIIDDKTTENETLVNKKPELQDDSKD